MTVCFPSIHPLHMYNPSHCFLPSVTRMKGLETLVWFLLESIPYWTLLGGLGDE